MKYNFENIGTRYNTGSKKWAEMREYIPDIGEGFIPFSVADMELETAPEIREALKTYIDKHILGYANPTLEFKDSVVGWMKRRHGWTIDPDWMIGTHGVISAFYNAIKVFTKPGEGVLLTTPIYYPMYSGIRSNNRVLVDSPLINKGGRYEIDFDDFEKKAKDSNTKLFILCSPHNPSSRVWTHGELERMGRICIENNVIICSDEIHFDLVMPGYKHTVFADISSDFADHCITCTAPSKTFNLAGMQTATVIISNAALRKQYLDHILQDEANPKCNLLGYVANTTAYNECEAWLDKVLLLIEKNRQTITGFMAKHFPAVVMTRMEGTYLQWMDFNPLGIGYKELAKLLRLDAKLFFDDGYIFGPQGEGFERWNIACPEGYITKGLERLKHALDKRLGK